MKPRHTVMALAAMAGSSHAATSLINTDFTTYADLTAAQADGWSQTTRNGRGDALNVNGTNGLESVGWKQSTLNKALAGSVDLSSDAAYTINYRQLTNSDDSAALFALTSATSSFVMGQSYNTDPEVNLGFVGEDVLTSSTWWTFQTGAGNGEIAIAATPRNSYVGNGWTNFEIVINASSAGTDSMTITATTDGGTTGDVINGFVHNFTSSDAYDGTGFLLESGTTTAFSDVSITVVPEPSSTALLGLGGLALILRRRK